MSNQNWQDWLDNYLQGTANEDTLKKLEQWTNSSEENRELFRALVQVYKKDLPPWYDTLSEEEGWQELRGQLVQPDLVLSPTRPVNTNIKKIRVLLLAVSAAAAAVLFIVFTPFYNQPYVEYVAEGFPKEVLLPDSSRIKLNKNSKVRLLPGFGLEHRKVEQQGQVYYEVARNRDLPFRIATAHSVVEVLGTRFDLQSTAESKAENLSVLEGVVRYQLHHPAGPSKVVSAGQSLTYRGGAQTLIAMDSVVSNRQIAWTGKLIFDQSRLSDIVADLEAHYHTPISIEESSTARCRFTGSFQNNSLEDVLQVICFSLGIKYQKTNNQYILIGIACKQATKQ